MASDADPLVTLTSSRWALEGASDFWALVIQLSTVAIGVGVFIEVVATCFEIVEDRKDGKPLPFHSIMTLVGGAVVAIALIFEFFAEFSSSSVETGLRKNNAAAQGVLDKRARDATKQAVEIAQKFGGLNAMVGQKEREMDEIVQSLSGRTDKAINALSQTENGLQKAQGDAVASAGKAASAAEVANKTAISMNETLNSERQMEAQMRAIITHRTLTDAEVTVLVQTLKPFAKTPFDLFVFDDPDSRELVMRLENALTQAAWEWRDAPGIGGLEIDPPGGKRIGLATLRGISLEISESGKLKLEKPVVALFNALSPKGWALRASAAPDEKIDKPYDHNVVHIFMALLQI